MNSTYVSGLMEKFIETMHVNTWYRATSFCSRALNMIQESVMVLTCPYFFRLKTLEGKALPKKQKRTTQAKCPWSGREE